MKPVIVFTADTVFEAQLARDLLVSAQIPVFHVPGLTTGVFGMRQDTRVAVPEEHVAAAVEVLRDAGFEAEPSAPARGIEEFRGAFRQAFPKRGGRSWFLWILALGVFGWGLILVLRRVLAVL